MQADNAVEQKIEIKALFKSSWQSLPGLKKPFWGGLFIEALVSLFLLFAISFLSALFFKTNPAADHRFHWILQITLSLVGFLLSVGLLMIVLRKQLGEPAKARQVLNYLNWKGFKKLWGLAILHWISTLLVVQLSIALVVICMVFNRGDLNMSATLSFSLFAVLVVLVLLAMSFIWISCINAVLVVLNTNTNAYAAFNLSIKKLWKQFFKVMAVWVLSILILLASLVPLMMGLHVFQALRQGVLLLDSEIFTRIVVLALAVSALCVIWTLPWIAGVYTSLYRVVFKE